MTLVIGVDEAGYAPNLGPLVIGITAWRVADAEFNFFRALRGCVQPNGSGSSHKLVVADSKSVYRSGGPLAPLEQTVFSLLAALDSIPRRVDELMARMNGFDNMSRQCPDDLPEFFDWRGLDLPLECSLSRIQRDATRLRWSLRQSGASLIAVGLRGPARRVQSPARAPRQQGIATFGVHAAIGRANAGHVR